MFYQVESMYCTYVPARMGGGTGGGGETGGPVPRKLFRV